MCYESVVNPHREHALPPSGTHTLVQSLCVRFFFLRLHECPAKTCLEGVTEVVGGAGVTPAFD